MQAPDPRNAAEIALRPRFSQTAGACGAYRGATSFRRWQSDGRDPSA